jgi:predicted DNA binding protein
MYEAILRISGHSSYADATAGTAATIRLWCNRNCDLLYVTEEAAEAVTDQVRETVGVRERLENRDETVLVTGDCLLDHESDLIDPFLDRHDCLVLYPLRYENGDKICRILSLTAATLTECYRDLTDAGIAVTVDSKREIEFVKPRNPLLAPGGVVPELTDRQSEAIHCAYENGYYEIPREVTTDRIASEMGIERRTAEEHLRRAENKLLASMIDFLG